MVPYKRMLWGTCQQAVKGEETGTAAWRSDLLVVLGARESCAHWEGEDEVRRVVGAGYSRHTEGGNEYDSETTPHSEEVTHR